MCMYVFTLAVRVEPSNGGRRARLVIDHLVVARVASNSNVNTSMGQICCMQTVPTAR